MGIFNWFFPKAKEAVAERVVPPGFEESSEEPMLSVFHIKYDSFYLPYGMDSEQLLEKYNECIADIRAAKDPNWIIKINYCAIKCIDAIAKYYLKMSNMALNRNRANLIFYVLKNGLSSIDLRALTVPETEKIFPIIKMITSTNIPEEIKFFQVHFKYLGDIDIDIDIPQLNLAAIEKILDFFKTYKEILFLLNTEIKNQGGDTIFGGYNAECFGISEFIKKSEESLRLVEQSAGSDIEIFREEYLCHSTNAVMSISTTRLFFKRDVWFCFNEVHTASRPTLIFSVADILKEAKERNLNFAFALTTGGYSRQLYFIPKYNLFYDENQKKYWTFAETKALIKNDRWNAAIYTEKEKALENLALRAPGVFVLSDEDLKLIYPPVKTIGKQYPLFEIKIVPQEQQNPQKRMFVGDKTAGYYLLTTSEGRQILKSMLASQK